MRTLVLTALLVLLTVAPAIGEEKGLDKKVTVNFAETSLDDAMSFFAQYSKVNVLLDSGDLLGDKLITVKLTDVTVRAAMSAITTTLGLAWDERWGGVFVATKKRLDALSKDTLPLPAKGEESRKSVLLRGRLKEKKAAFNFDEASVMDALEFLRAVHGFNLVVDDAIHSELRKLLFDGQVNSTTIGDALAIILVPRGLTAEILDGVVFVRKAGPRKVTAKPSPKKNVPKALDEAQLQLNFLETPLLMVTTYLQRKLSYPIHVDPKAHAGRSQQELAVNLASRVPISGRTALNLVTTVKALDWDIRWGGVFIATKKRLAALPKDILPKTKSGDLEPWETTLRKALVEKKLTFDGEGSRLTKVLAYVSRQAGINILIEPKASVAATKAYVEHDFVRRPLGELLTVILVPNGLTFELAHEVVVVRLAE